MNNRITGDFDADTIEAFRAAYAASMEKPEDHDIDPFAQIPTNVISNTSPWIQHTGLWKANDGMSRDFKPNQPFNLDDYFPSDDTELVEDSGELEEELPGSSGNEEVEEVETMTEEEFQSLADEIWDDEGATYYPEETAEEEFEEEDDELDEKEIEELIKEILGSSEEEDEEYEDSTETDDTEE